MSKQSTQRANAIDKDYDALAVDSARAVSSLVTQTALLKVLIVFLHDNLLNNKGDLSEGDRADTRASLGPLYPQIQNSLDEITKIFSIYDDDLTVWQSNFDTYVSENPTVLTEALNRFPKVD